MGVSTPSVCGGFKLIIQNKYAATAISISIHRPRFRCKGKIGLYTAAITKKIRLASSAPIFPEFGVTLTLKT
jgi:hypothetical protein